MALIAALTACRDDDSSNAGELPAGGNVAPSPRANCGAGSQPETGTQGRVPLEEYENGRAARGYTCNAELIGSYAVPNAVGTVGGYKVERYVDRAGHECAYYDTTLIFPTNIFSAEAGVNVLDMSDPAHPVLVERLTTPAMLSPHESLVLNQPRGLLVAVTGNPASYPGVVDIYDVSGDCRHPVLKSSTPVGLFGHESGMAPDGQTFYSASPGGTLVAIDISNPALPHPLSVLNVTSHGLSISDDGDRAYVAAAFTDKALVILDTSEVQSRASLPAMREIARLTWEPMSTPQAAIPVTIKGRPYLVEIDEFGAQSAVGAGRIIDISDETRPRVISNLRLEVHQPENFTAQADDPGVSSVRGYAGHYCNVPRRDDPEIVACSMILSGLRVFDIRDPLHPQEVAYFNAPIEPRAVAALEGNWAMSSPEFVPERREIWYSDVTSGFYAVRLTNGVWEQHNGGRTR